MADGRHLLTSTNVIFMDLINSLLKTGNKTANINVQTAVYARTGLIYFVLILCHMYF